jgi:hypothetical protein
MPVEASALRNQVKLTTRIWQIWLVICLAACLVQSITLTHDPRIQQDEVQIVDMGRSVLDPSTDWGITWNVKYEIPISPVYYLGPALQELAFRATRPSNFGPRFLSVIAAALAATCLLGWLMVRKTPEVAALVLASAFLLDPEFSVTYRDARVDAWAFASCFAACWFLRSLGRPDSTPNLNYKRLFLAGVFVATSGFFWPSALMLMPLVFLEFLKALYPWLNQADSAMLQGWAKPTFVFGAGGLVTVFLLLVPVLLNWDVYRIAFESIVSVQVDASIIQTSLLDLLFANNPMIAVAALVALAIRRDYGLLIALALAVVLMYQTMIYQARMIYLTPYLLVMIAGAATFAWQGSSTGITKKILSRILAALLLWNASLVMVIRPITSLMKAQDPPVEQSFDVLRDSIGAGPHRVLVEEWSVYFAGRELGWKMFRAGAAFTRSDYIEFLETMDYIILLEKPLNGLTLQLIRERGYELHYTIQFPQPEPIEMNWGVTRYYVVPGSYRTMFIYKPEGPQKLRD